MLHTILGAKGVIGTELANELRLKDVAVRLVSREPKNLGRGEETLAADLLDGEAVNRATKGSSTVYVTAGLPYDSRIWQAQWPKIIDNVIDACKAHRARLVFFDNVYMYGPVDGWMTEGSPIRPTSVKGKVRAEIAEKLLQAAQRGDVDVRIARSADFSGPGASTGFLNILMFPRLQDGKRPQWFARGDKRHSLTFTKDAALATAILGVTDTLPRGQRVWHVPTDRAAPTAETWAREVANALSVAEKPLQTLPPLMLRLVGLFNRQLAEFREMLYQYDRDYLFSSEAFERDFKVAPTPYRTWLEETARDYES